MKDSGQYDFLPLLGRGKHRNPRRGACFMELASYLAGERWSDSPTCTHRLLAHMARLVNDFTDDAQRPLLAPLIPSVIGLQSSDPRWDHELALLAAAHALPVAAESSQRSLAVGMLACERLYAEVQGRPSGSLSARTRQAFAEVPLAEKWARSFMATSRTTGSQSPGAPVIECATRSIAFACVPDPDARLRALLIEAIDLCRELSGRDAVHETRLTRDDWSPVCQPVRV
ncbi:hypothetical protein [Tessaracoccus antarcticus]|uniref:hypothetical protein n=1 Tax=Tessaracoccus antarcticus TaxID=2479848 RepID=UPI0018F3291A|nr:hypothetical protein [Tessaracoccus antarcticus]